MRNERITGKTPLGFEYARDLPEVKDYRVQTPRYARALEWTTDPPEKGGWYWIVEKVYKKTTKENKPRVVYFNGRGIDDPWLNPQDIERWLGPLPIPEPPEGE